VAEQSKGLLVLKLSSYASDEVLAELTQQITPTAEALGVEPMVLPFGVDVDLKMGSEALLERICVALERLVAQGEPPQLGDANVADIAPQALNARPSSLNSRPAYSHGEDEPCSPPKDMTFPLDPHERVSLSSDRSGQIQGAVAKYYGIRSKGR
jgi:hypothetical protein